MVVFGHIRHKDIDRLRESFGRNNPLDTLGTILWMKWDTGIFGAGKLMISFSSDMSEMLQAAFTSPIFGQVQRRLLRQLMESLIYERLIATSCENVNGEIRYVFHGSSRDGHSVRYQAQGCLSPSFGRIKLNENSIIRIQEDGSEGNLSILDFVDSIGDELNAEPCFVEKFKRELELTLVNDAIAQFIRQEQRWILRGQSYDVVETGLSDGHPYHPCYKSRVGFSFDDNLAYAPEFGQPIHPVLLAAHEDITETAHSTGLDINAFQQNEFPSSLMDRMKEQSRARGYRSEDYRLIPVHPWQWCNIIYRVFGTPCDPAVLSYAGPGNPPGRGSAPVAILCCV